MTVYGTVMSDGSARLCTCDWRAVGFSKNPRARTKYYCIAYIPNLRVENFRTNPFGASRSAAAARTHVLPNILTGGGVGGTGGAGVGVYTLGASAAAATDDDDDDDDVVLRAGARVRERSYKMCK